MERPPYQYNLSIHRPQFRPGQRQFFGHVGPGPRGHRHPDWPVRFGHCRSHHAQCQASRNRASAKAR